MLSTPMLRSTLLWSNITWVTALNKLCLKIKKMSPLWNWAGLLNSTWHHNTILTNSHPGRTRRSGQQSHSLIHRNGSQSLSLPNFGLLDHHYRNPLGHRLRPHDGRHGWIPRLHIHCFPGNGDPCCTSPGVLGSNLTTDHLTLLLL